MPEPKRTKATGTTEKEQAKLSRRFYYPVYSQIGIIIGGLLLIYGLFSKALDNGNLLYYAAGFASVYLVCKLVFRRAA
jgi:hypothetical protein